MSAHPAPITTYTSRVFILVVAAAKRAAANGPGFITDRGEPAYALLSIEEYHRLRGGSQPRTLLEVMQSIPGGDFEFEPPKLDDVAKPFDFDAD